MSLERRGSAIFVLSLLVAFAGSYPAQACVQGEPGTIENPQWLRRPTPQDLGSLLRRESPVQPPPGRVVLSCSVTAVGGLRACQVVEEAPAGAGYAGEALPMAAFFEMALSTPDGRCTAGSRVGLAIRFQYPEEPEQD